MLDGMTASGQPISFLSMRSPTLRKERMGLESRPAQPHARLGEGIQSEGKPSGIVG